MDVLEGGARVVCLCLVALMLLAAIHKARVLQRGEADTEPLMQVSERLTRHATPLLSLALVAEVVVALLLVLVPVAGLAAALVLLAAYSSLLRKLSPDASCNCFGNFLRDSRSAALRRNLGIGVVGTAALMVAAVGEVAPVSQGTVGVAVLAGTVLASVALTKDIGRRAGTAAQSRARQEGGWFAA